MLSNREGDQLFPRRYPAVEGHAAEERPDAEEYDEDGGDAEHRRLQMGSNAGHQKANRHKSGNRARPEYRHDEYPGEKTSACSGAHKNGIQ